MQLPISGRMAFMLISGLSALLTATSAAAQGGPDPPPKRIAVYDDLQYRSGGNAAWRLDLAMPENYAGQRHPAIVIIHGGGWSGGSRRDRPYRSMLVEYALKGYVTLSIDYRVLPEAPVGEQLEDVHCAVRWLRAHADQYHVDPDRIGAWGHSAGAHLALMLGVSPPAPVIQGDCEWNQHSSRVAAIAAGAVPTFLPRQFGDSARYSPDIYISREMGPLLLIQGGEDDIVAAAAVDDYVARLKAAGAPDVTYLRIDRGNHGVAYEHYMEPAMKAITEFFARTLKP